MASGWILGASWFVFVQPASPVPNSYFSQDSKLAKCRQLRTSEARYQCTSEAMLAKDNADFNRTFIIILLPPLALLIGYLGVTRVVITHHDRVKSRAAHIASQRRMAEWRGHLNEIKAGLATRQSEDLLLTASERPSGTPTHLARRR